MVSAAPEDHFVTTWKTDNRGSTGDTTIRVPMSGGPYDVDWNNDLIFDEFGLNGTVTHDFGTAGIYTIRIRGAYDSIRVGLGGDGEKIISLIQWGSQSWTTMISAFSDAKNLTLSAIDTPDFSAVTNMSYMFHYAYLANPDTSAWDTSKVTTMNRMFFHAREAVPDTSGWDTSAVTNMGYMFWYAFKAEPDTSGWDTSAVTNMGLMFVAATSANPDTSGWDTSNVIEMYLMFFRAISANPDTSGWDTSKVTSMASMFNTATSANPDTSGWDTAAVTGMSAMFSGAIAANPDISGWDTSSVTTMNWMFAGATSFDRDLGSWDVTALTDASSMFDGVILSINNYENLLTGWNAQVLQPGLLFSGGNSNYCSAPASAARANMIAMDSWVISDGGLACPPTAPDTAPDLTPESDTGISDSDNLTSNSTPGFYIECSNVGNTISLYTDNPAANTTVGIHLCSTIGVETALVVAPLLDGSHTISFTDTIETAESSGSPTLSITIANAPLEPQHDFVTTWKTDNPGALNSASILIPMVGGPYNVDWDNDGIFDEFGVTDFITHEFEVAGTYTIRIRGGYDSIHFFEWGTQGKIISLDQWGTNTWTTMHEAFLGALNLQVPATDIPDFSAVTSMRSMFNGASLANPDTGGWDTSSVTSMSRMFWGASLANPDTSGWNTSSVTTMFGMFNKAITANPDTSGWDTSSVNIMMLMFGGATSANPDTSGWNTSLVTYMGRMFAGAISANPDTSDWNTSSVIYMYEMFANAISANPDTSDWNTSSVTDMSSMFFGASLANPDVSRWNTSSVTSLAGMFHEAESASPDVSGWDISKVQGASGMFIGADLPTAMYDSLLIAWDAQTLQRNVRFGAGNSVYCSVAATAARENMIASDSWGITDGGQGCTPNDPIQTPDLTPRSDTGVSDSDNITSKNKPDFYVACSAVTNVINLYTDNPTRNTLIGSHECLTVGVEIVSVTIVLLNGAHSISYTDTQGSAVSGQSPSLSVVVEPPYLTDHFVTTWKTDNPGGSSSTSVAIPILGGPYDVDWNNDGIFDEFDLIDYALHDYGVPGTYTIRFRGSYHAFRFNSFGDKAKLISLNQWGTNSWSTMWAAFHGATNLRVEAVDTPDLSKMTNMRSMFGYARLANPDTSNWETSTITDMSNLFYYAESANPDTSSWDTSAVTTMSGMFLRAASANPDTSIWDTSQVRDMSDMFAFSAVANPDTSNWDTSSVVTMSGMFYEALSANPNTIGWDTSSVMSMFGMFSGAISAKPDTGNWDTSAVTNMDGMFSQATVANPDTSRWDTSVVTSMLSMFAGTTIANPDTSKWDTSVVTNMSWMFAGTSVANPDTSSWDTSKVFDMSGMFSDATTANPNTSDWNTVRLRTSKYMFSGAKSANPNIKNWNLSALTTADYMFKNATVANPEISSWDTSAIVFMTGMFEGASSFDQDIGSWNVTSLREATWMFEGVSLSTANYESLLIGWNSQLLIGGVFFMGGNSKYCSDVAVAARANIIASHLWNILDGGQGCPVAPTDPSVAPDLTTATDSGLSNSDNITANSSPQFEVVCSAIGNSITLYTDKPAVHTAVGTHTCTTVGVEIAATSAVLIDGIHNISYIDQYIGERSGHSPALVVTIDTVAAGPGNLSAPGSPINDVNADIAGSCGQIAANDTVVVTTSMVNGFTTLYNTPITLDGNGSFSIVDPNWSEGTFTLHFECSDVAGNSATLGPFGPILIDLSCSGVDTVVTGDFLAGMHLCAGTSSLVTSGTVNIEAGAVVYFQSPKITLNPDFNVSEGASFITSSVVGPVAPLLLGPSKVKASIGDVVVFSESHICEDLEDGVLAITPLDTGVLVESEKAAVFTLSCMNADGKTTEKNVIVITE